MTTNASYGKKLSAGTDFPVMKVTNLDDHTVELGKPREGTDWQMIVVYRGKHCPICTKFLNNLEKKRARLIDMGVDLIAVSADSKQQLQEHIEDLDVNFSLGYGLTTEQLGQLGVYVSDPRSPEETDHPFAEPGLFVVTKEGKILAVDVANNPFCRPDIDTLVDGLQFVKNPDNNYPIRGTRDNS
ncbi:redoxin domain-containing protein [Salinimonas marina]|uniref:Redoxin domain-containing protein n=1 Tax=Salinimonas marina TaxID=2785918 RepID=A0A7S9HDW6_9ALTE|nr:redoxin domain-containing protein [Salinimonas marina]QPG06352.1 redoxin domain-containing protein [Salinimonas marina]